MAEEFENIITLSDSDGSEADYEILDVVPYGDSEYAVLLPVDDDSDPVEAVILKVLPGEDDEDTLAGVEDAELLEKVYAEFVERNRDEFGFTE